MKCLESVVTLTALKIKFLKLYFVFTFVGEEPFLPGDYRSTLTLVQHSDKDKTSTMIWMVLSSVFLLRTLQLSGYFGPKRHLVIIFIACSTLKGF